MNGDVVWYNVIIIRSLLIGHRGGVGEADDRLEGFAPCLPGDRGVMREKMKGRSDRRVKGRKRRRVREDIIVTCDSLLERVPGKAVN